MVPSETGRLLVVASAVSPVTVTLGPAVSVNPGTVTRSQKFPVEAEVLESMSEIRKLTQYIGTANVRVQVPSEAVGLATFQTDWFN